MSEADLLAACTAAGLAVRDAKANKTGDVKALVGALLAAKEEYKVRTKWIVQSHFLPYRTWCAIKLAVRALHTSHLYRHV